MPWKYEDECRKEDGDLEFERMEVRPQIARCRLGENHQLLKTPFGLMYGAKGMIPSNLENPARGV